MSPISPQPSRQPTKKRERERERERDQANLEGGRELELGLDVWIRLETCLVDGSGAVGSRYSELLEGRRALRHKVEALSLASRCGQRCCCWGLVGVEEAAVLLVVEGIGVRVRVREFEPQAPRSIHSRQRISQVRMSE